MSFLTGLQVSRYRKKEFALLLSIDFQSSCVFIIKLLLLWSWKLFNLLRVEVHTAKISLVLFEFVVCTQSIELLFFFFFRSCQHTRVVRLCLFYVITFSFLHNSSSAAPECMLCVGIQATAAHKVSTRVTTFCTRLNQTSEVELYAMEFFSRRLFVSPARWSKTTTRRVELDDVLWISPRTQQQQQ